MNKNVVIVNFNTQKLTEACIKSINKHTQGCHIYVFDNSDKTPFINMFDNVDVIDNTKQQVVNFEEVLVRHEARSKSKATDNNFGSLKHCMAVDYMFDVINDGFILFDSDTLIKRDFSDLFDENVIYSGQQEMNSPRLKLRTAPYVLFINTKMCREKGIRFFDEGHMFGLYGFGEELEKYDTGAWFYEATRNLPKKEIRYNNYVIHFRAGSWLEDAKAKQNYKPIYSEDTWLNKYKLLWQ